jgi:hypothetical protein
MRLRSLGRAVPLALLLLRRERFTQARSASEGIRSLARRACVPSLALRACATLLIAAVMAVAWLAPPGLRGEQPLPDSRQKFKVLIVAVDHYDDPALPPLKQAVNGGIKLAGAFRPLRYEVTVLVDRPSLARARERLPEGMRVDVAGLEPVHRWLEALEPGETRLAFLVLVGHGVERTGRPWFLTPEAKPDEGGFDLAEVDERASAYARDPNSHDRPWPLALVVDACRRDVPTPKGAEPSTPGPVREPGRPGTRFAELGAGKRGDVKLTGFRRVTRVISTRAGKTAEDTEHDLIDALAEALRIERDQRFVAASSRAAASLSLFDFFHFGVTKMSYDRRLEQLADVEVGSPSLTELLGQSDPPGPPAGRPPVGPRDVDLLPLWRPEEGAFDYRPQRGRALTLFCPRLEEPKDRWIAGFVAEPGEGFDTTGKALFAEVLLGDPQMPVAGRPAPRSVSVAIDAKYVNHPAADVWLSPGGEKTFFALVPSQVTWCKLPLEPGGKLNYIGVSDGLERWPRYKLTVRQMYLGDAKAAVPAADAGANLLPRWWGTDANWWDENALPVTTGTVDGRTALRVGRGKNGTGWRGGALGPGVWVSKGDVVEVEIQNSSDADVQVLLHVKDEYVRLGEERLTVAPGRARYRVPVALNGQFNYFALLRPSGDLLLLSMAVKPGKRTWAEKTALPEP